MSRGTPQQKNQLNQPGYIAVFASSRVGSPVFFDKVNLTYYKGTVLEENHYYPFGLTLSTQSGNANEKNNYKYQGIELNKDLDIETYEAYFRNLDPQTGRWWQIDPKLDSFRNFSPYVSMNDNPAHNTDFLGDKTRISGFTQTEFLGWLGKGVKNDKLFSFKKNGDLTWNKKEYKKLSDDQKAVADNIIGTIEDKKRTFTAIKSDDKTVIGEEKGKTVTLGDKGGGALTNTDKNDPNKVNIYLDPNANFNDASFNINSKTTGTSGLTSPVQIVLYHELGGEAYLRYGEGYDPYPGSHSVDYENKVRLLNGLPLRGYDRTHSDDPREY